MAWLDGAVNGMVLRLIPAGFTPDEAYCLAQAAYIKERKRAQGVPSTVLERQQVSFEINQTLYRLGPFPTGPEAHRQRIILWEKVFGPGSWHERIDPEEIYGRGADMQPDSIVPNLMLHKDAADAAFIKLSYTGPQEGEFASNVDKIRRGFEALAGGHSLFCMFETEESMDVQKGLIACAQDKVGLFTMQSLAKGGDPIPGDRIMDLSSIRDVGYTSIPGELEAAELAQFTAFELPHMAMRIILKNAEVWDLGFSVKQMGGHDVTPYVNFLKGFHQDYQKWRAANTEVKRPVGDTVEEITPATSMTTARRGHTATLLPNDRVLVAGGEGGSVLSSAELYDPSTGQFRGTSTMHVDRTNHTATLLQDGTVLIAGGRDDNYATTANAELYDPVAGTWAVTSSMATARESHTATLLPNGSVMVVGGHNDLETCDSTEIYNPVTREWSTTGSLRRARYDHSMIQLSNGAVLVCGGVYGGINGEDYLESCELHDPASGTWSTITHHEQADKTATLLDNGSVLFVSGAAGASLYNPISGDWSTAASPASKRSAGVSATLLPNGRVLIFGGTTPPNSGASTPPVGPGTAEIYDVELNSWFPVAGTGAPRFLHAATLLANGTVMISGGNCDYGTTLASVEFWG
ncbi:Kelch repeat-containing protein [Pseudarthrobacter sp. LMD1-1-1.1]|uniref:Kelch repeat-containing protein n=1 Tax=Pseudarthrobacter sp. LMD1-1-1.1 TaxID=3135242 RepID=UPI00341D5821